MKLRLPFVPPLRRIGWRIFLPFTVLLVGVAVIFSVVGLQFASKTIRANAGNELKILSVILSQQVAKQLYRLEESLTSMENHGFLVEELKKPSPDKVAIEQFLQARLKTLPGFEDLAVFNRQGQCVGSTDASWYELQAKQQPFFVSGLRSFNFSDMYTSDEGRIQLVSTPITNGTVTKGVLIGQVNMSSIYDLMDQKLGVSDNTDAFLIDSAMRFITPGKTGIDLLLESHLVSTPLAQHLNQEFWADEYLNFNGEKVLGTALRVPTSRRRWYVVVERDLAEVTRPIDAAKRWIAVVSLLLVAVLIVMSFVLTRSITRPLMTLVEGARRVARGDFKHPFTVPEGIDELAFLGSEFDKMRAKVRAFQESMTQRLEESERRRLESERLAAIGTLASTLAHEIRNPLNAMSLLLARLEFAKSSHAAQMQVTRDLKAEIARLDRLVSDILDYARPLTLQFKEVDLRKLVAEVADLYRAVMEKKQIDFHLELPDHSVRLRVDPDRVKQCLVNLLQNAFEAVNEMGQVKMSVRVDIRSAHVFIRDNGIGLPAQPEGRFFDLFFTTKDTGTGLGLSTVKKIMDAHGGQVSIGPSRGVAEPGLSGNAALLESESNETPDHPMLAGTEVHLIFPIQP